jgi:aspartyl-tRNA(Asn)/glutamyl-tRNA(Gln) amidotransferase subunit B
VNEHGLSLEDAGILAESKDLGDFFDRALPLLTTLAPSASSLFIGPTKAYLKETKQEFHATSITPENLSDLVHAVADGTIGSTIAKPLLLDLLVAPGDVNQMIKEKGLAQISDESVLRTIVLEVLAKSAEMVEEYKKGKVKVRQSFVGQVMKATSGKANAQVLNKILEEELAKLQ